jgi:hypothetical protein
MNTMKHETKEIIVTLTPENIVETKTNVGVTELTLEASAEVIRGMNKIYAFNKRPKGSLIIMPSFYIKKDVLKAYISNEKMNYVALALVSNSFASNLIANVLLAVRDRVKSLKNKTVEPSKVFRDRADAVKWLTEEIQKAQK